MTGLFEVAPNLLNPPDGGVPPSEQLFQDAATPPAAHCWPTAATN